ncbi:MAG: CocE/NonD family hydrolase [Caldilineaceae bacterium]
MITQELMIPMRDGISLQSAIFLPESDGPFPSLMVRCMYGIDQRIRQRAESFVAAGYAVVAQNVRGRHQSEGGQISFADFPEDGFDTLEWMVAQPWCNGRVGAFGGSALARVQIATALTGHPAFRAMCPMALPYGPSSRFGGSFLLHQIPLWLFLALSGPELKPVDQIDWMCHLNKLPATAILDDQGGPLALFRGRHPSASGRRHGFYTAGRVSS